MVEKIANHIYVLALGAFFADVLANLEVTQLPDDGRPNNHSHEERCKAGEGCPERDVTENTERRKVRE
jgi:hypothetical protein